MRPPPPLKNPEDMGMTDQPIVTHTKLYKCINIQGHQGTPDATQRVQEEADQGGYQDNIICSKFKGIKQSCIL